MNSLYRKEVYEHRQSQSAGSIILRPPRIGWAFLVLSGCFILAAILFLVFGHYVRHETVSGYLVLLCHKNVILQAIHTVLR